MRECAVWKGHSNSNFMRPPYIPSILQVLGKIVLFVKLMKQILTHQRSCWPSNLNNDCTVFYRTQLKQHLVNNMWCCKNCCNENLTFPLWLHGGAETSLGFPFPVFYILFFYDFPPPFHLSFLPSLILFSPSSLAPVVTVTTRPSSPRCRCRTRHAHGSPTLSHSCPSQPPPRATTDAEGEVSLWPSTSRSAQPTATALNMDTLSESPSESICSCLCVCIFCGHCLKKGVYTKTRRGHYGGGQRMKKGRLKMTV